MSIWKDKKILVIGLARSGMSTSQLLLSLGAKLIVNDARPLTQDENALKLKAQGVRVEGGGHPLHLLEDDVDLVIKNPGIPYNNPLIMLAESKGIPVITEIELAASLLKAPLIGITGSNGKTTTSTLLAEMFRNDHRDGKTYLVGNIGMPLSEIAEVANQTDDIIIELSSFQLQGTINFKPHIAVLTNIYAAHLDYHGSETAYKQAKLKITANQNADDYLIYNADQPGLYDMIKEQTKAKLIPFSAETYLGNGASVKDEKIFFQEEMICPVSSVLLPGFHNVQNALAAIAAAKLSGISNQAIVKTLESFYGVEHRIEYIGSIDGRKFYNDSKSTNVSSTITALNSFQAPIHLIAGGLDRKLSLDDLTDHLDGVSSVAGIGETGEQVVSFMKNHGIECAETVRSVQAAVRYSFEQSKSGDIILLSPAHASWDQYVSFEERGADFKRAFEEIKREI